jgi:trans-2,3-dihydro-3-hydroxyanthranilate isomerase
VIVSEKLVQLNEGEALRLETGAGLVPVAVSGDPPLDTMTQQTPEFAPYDIPLDTVASWIGLAPGDIVRAAYVSTGLRWPIAQVASLEAMRRVRPEFSLMGTNNISIFCIGAQAPEASVHVRTFAPSSGVYEDPVTGSSNGCIAAFIAQQQLIPARDGVTEYVAEQGIEIGQPGCVFARVEKRGGALEVRIGGYAVTALQGELRLPDA